MGVFSKSDIIKMVDVLANESLLNEVYFCELDSSAGDGDFGMSLAKGFKVIKKEWDNLNNETISSFLKSCSMIILEECGGATGPIWGNAFLAASQYTKSKNELSYIEFAELLESASNGIMKVGKAQLGDKTLLDALIPCANTLKEISSNVNYSKSEFLKYGADAAVKGAENTKDIVAKKGRASYLGDRSISHPDAGAVAIGVLFTKISDSF